MTKIIIVSVILGVKCVKTCFSTVSHTVDTNLPLKLLLKFDCLNGCLFVASFAASLCCVFKQDLQHHLLSACLWWLVMMWPDSLCPGHSTRRCMDPSSTWWQVTRTSPVARHPAPAPCLQPSVERNSLSRSLPPMMPGLATHPAPWSSLPVSSTVVTHSSVCLCAIFLVDK